MMNVGSLFSGIGGFDLAARWLGWRTAWFSEIDPYASSILKRHWPNVPNHGDITTIKGADVEKVDLLCGGFPCQDISVAGKGKGITGARSGLWSHYARLIQEIRPRWVVAENSPRLRSLGLDRVLKDLSSFGYDAEWHCVPASAVGAPHQRDRIWIVAYPSGQFQFDLFGRCWDEGGGSPTPARTMDVVDEGSGTLGGGPEGSHEKGSNGFGPSDGCVGSPVPNPDSQRREEQHASSLAAREELDPWGSPQGRGVWSLEPGVGRVAHGIPSRVDRLRCLGNAVVPQVPYLLFKAIEEADAGSHSRRRDRRPS